MYFYCWCIIKLNCATETHFVLEGEKMFEKKKKKMHIKVLVQNKLKYYLATMLSVAVILLVSLTGSPSWQHGDTWTVPLMLCWMPSRS